MLTIKSDDVYGRSKAYEAIIKGTEIVGPKVPESFNVLVKELQGLGLKIDLVASDKVIDAEEVLAENIKDEAANLSDVDVPAPSISDIDVSEDIPNDEFVVMELDDDMPATTVITDDDTVVVATDEEEGEEA